MSNIIKVNNTTDIEWDPKTKTLSGHYTTESVSFIIDRLILLENSNRKNTPNFSFLRAHVDRFVVLLGLQLGLPVRAIKEVPTPISKWAKRVYKLYIHKNIYNSWRSQQISTRNALDYTDYVDNINKQAELKQALNSEISNKQFRTSLKE